MLVGVFIISLESTATPAVHAYHYVIRVGAPDSAQAQLYAYQAAMAFLLERRGDPAGLQVTRTARDERLRATDGDILEFRAAAA